MNFCHFVFYCGTEFVFLIFFSFTSNILSGRGDIAHKYHKSTTYYFHWKLIFYIRYDWIGWNDAGLEDIIPYTAADRHKHHSEQERGASCFSTAGGLRTALPAVQESKTPKSLGRGQLSSHFPRAPGSGAPRMRAEKPVLSCSRFPSFSVFDAAFKMNS